MGGTLSGVIFLFETIGAVRKARRQPALENLALRQQLAMRKPLVKRPRASTVDRVFWILVARYVDGQRAVLRALNPIRWNAGMAKAFVGTGIKIAATAA